MCLKANAERHQIYHVWRAYLHSCYPERQIKKNIRRILDVNFLNISQLVTYCRKSFQTPSIPLPTCRHYRLPRGGEEFSLPFSLFLPQMFLFPLRPSPFRLLMMFSEAGKNKGETYPTFFFAGDILTGGKGESDSSSPVRRGQVYGTRERAHTTTSSRFFCRETVFIARTHRRTPVHISTV